ncbi:AraC family transcriptional regulator [Mycobacterium sp.]|uniref:AraC family transcriptional regulator n=1 Tax=Mycobacterium sp. TaxID=1785 RepID=UPI00128959A4|nr:AraC family transcriptional regulator [Mycobacterium sp.]KAA8963995.1 MAG: AraC family transcriptional regulator [Mycobacterium sp.]
MSVVRGTSLSNYPHFVSELGGDPDDLLRKAGIRPHDVGNYDVFLPLRAVLRAIESAAAATATADFGRRLARRQGIEIIGPVGVAARTAATLAHALAICGTFLSAYSPAIGISMTELDNREFLGLEFLLEEVPPCPQSVELSLGVSLGMLRFLLGSDYTPVSVHLPHDPLTSVSDYAQYFGCKTYFAQRTTGFMLRNADLSRPLQRDDVTHNALVEYLKSISTCKTALAESICSIVRQLLPTGRATLDIVADHCNLHPKTLQRRLADEGTTFAALVDQVRKETAGRYLRDTQISLSHLTREIGYAEQSVLSRSCQRWFGCSPSDYRKNRRPGPADAGRRGGGR